MKYDLYRLLAVTAHEVNRRGWCPQYQARRRGFPLLATVQDVIRTYETCRPTGDEFNEAHATIRWASALGPFGQFTDQYRRDLKALAMFGWVAHYEAGTAASMLIAFRRDHGVPTKRRFISPDGRVKTMPPVTLQPAC